MSRFGFCGGSFPLRSLSIDAERTWDLLPENTEAMSGQSRLSLVDRPGYNIFANLGSTAVLGGFSCQPNGSTADRDFEVVQNGPNQSLIELFSDGSQKFRGQISPPTTTNVTFAQNGTQLAICTGGQVWVFTFATNTLTGPVSDLNGVNVAMIDYCDAFGIALVANSNKFQISALLDFTSWPGLNVGQVSEFPDNVVSMIVNQRGLWFFGRKATVPYYNAGFYPVPFVPVDGVFIESGGASLFGRAKLDNSVFWWDTSERGTRTARRTNGYIPQRISNHGIERLVSGYPDVSDAISWAEEREGHTLFVTYFPSGTGADGKAGAGATLVYDVSTGLWSEWTFANGKSGYREAFHARNHRFAWNKHLYGDWQSGNVYVSDFPKAKGSQWDFVTDAGSPIVRRRVGPPVSIENKRLRLRRLTLAIETGISPQPPLAGTSMYPSAYYLGDNKGGVWQVTCDDNGLLHAAKVVGVSADTIVLNDRITNVSYLLSIALDTNGDYDGTIATATAYDPQAPNRLPIATSSMLDCAIYIVNGQAQTLAPLASTRAPMITFRQSRDGHTWSQPRMKSCGEAGAYGTRVFFDRLGQIRLWVPEITFSDPVPLRITDAYLEGEGFQATPRTMKQFAENA